MATQKTHSVLPDGSLAVRYDDGFNADGSPAITTWNLRPDQLERHAPMFRDEMAPGDRSAFDDAVNEYAKQRGR